mgnify:CR=1 FL=1
MTNTRGPPATNDRSRPGPCDELPDTPSEVPHSVTGPCERDACHSRGRSPLYCSTCGDERVFEQPPCPDGHGEECPERACTECGTAYLVGFPPPAPPTVPAPAAAPEPPAVPAPAPGPAAGRAATERAVA